MIKVLSFTGAYCGRPTNPSGRVTGRWGGGGGGGKLCGQTSGNAFDIIRHDESCNGWELCIVWQLISHSEGLQRASSEVNQRGEKPHMYAHVDTRRHRQCGAERQRAETCLHIQYGFTTEGFLLPAHTCWLIVCTPFRINN